MISNNKPIGIFDSGVGGLSILAAINELLPKEDLIYVADSLHMPYGEKSEETIKSRTLSAANHLIKHNVKAIVLACNTATAAAGNELRSKLEIPIIGLEPAIKPAIEQSRSKQVGVLATNSTLNSQKYLDLKKRYGKGVNIIEKASPLFVNIVESAPTLDDNKIALIKKELDSFIQANVDCLVLGCTHYPFLTKVISEIMGENVALFESAMPVAQELKRRLENHLSDSNIAANITYFSSSPEAAQTAFDMIIDEKIELCSW